MSETKPRRTTKVKAAGKTTKKAAPKAAGKTARKPAAGQATPKKAGKTKKAAPTTGGEVADSSGRADIVRSLPTLSEAAELIGIDPSGISRYIQRLQIEPLRWGGRDKHLRIEDTLRIASEAYRSSVKEVASGLEQLAARGGELRQVQVRQEAEEFLRGLPSPNSFVDELRQVMPERWAAQAEALYRRHYGS